MRPFSLTLALDHVKAVVPAEPGLPRGDPRPVRPPASGRQADPHLGAASPCGSENQEAFGRGRRERVFGEQPRRRFNPASAKRPDASGRPQPVPSPQAVVSLMEMGFDEKEVMDALRVNNNQQNAAVSNTAGRRRRAPWALRQAGRQVGGGAEISAPGGSRFALRSQVRCWG